MLLKELFLRSDGTFLGITYDRTLDALRTGWHQHQLGGVSDTTGTPPIVESLAIIPSPDGTTDDLWMSVKRYINGTTIRSIEYVTKLFESFNQPEDAFFVDCGATFDSPVVPTAIAVGAVTTITKAAHGLATGAKVRFRKVTGVAAPGATSSALNYTVFTITVLDANTFTVPLNSTGYSAFIVNGLAVYRKMVTTISGLTWLEGQTVQILGDGADMGTAVVASGAITLPSPGAGTVQIGLGYSSEIKGMRIEGGSADGTSMGKVRRIQEVQFMVDRSGTFEYGMNDYSAMFPVDMRQPSDPIDQATPLFTGIKDQLLISGDYETEEQITVRQRAPLPLTILAVMPQMTTYDKG